MRIAEITNPLHVARNEMPKGGDERHYLVLAKTTTKSLIRNHLCHLVPEDSRTPVICSRECDHYRYCEFGREYIRRLEHGL